MAAIQRGAHTSQVLDWWSLDIKNNEAWRSRHNSRFVSPYLKKTLLERYYMMVCRQRENKTILDFVYFEISFLSVAVNLLSESTPTVTDFPPCSFFLSFLHFEQFDVHIDSCDIFMTTVYCLYFFIDHIDIYVVLIATGYVTVRIHKGLCWIINNWQNGRILSGADLWLIDYGHQTTV